MQKGAKQKDIKGVVFVFLFSFVFYFFENTIRGLLSYIPHNPIFSINFVNNYGSLWSMFEGHSRLFLLLGVFIYLYFLIHIYLNVSFDKKTKIFGISLLLSGILGNTIERFFYGYVIDYIKLNFIDFPVFNIFDILITLGFLVYLKEIIRDEWIK